MVVTDEEGRVLSFQEKPAVKEAASDMINIGKVPDYWQAIGSVLQGEVRQVQIPGREGRRGIYTGLNVAADWDKITVQGPIYVGGMTRIGPGVRLVEKLVYGRYCVDRNGHRFDLQEPAPYWLITAARRQDVVAPSPQQKAMAELLGSDLVVSRAAEGGAQQPILS